MICDISIVTCAICISKHSFIAPSIYASTVEVPKQTVRAAPPPGASCSWYSAISSEERCAVARSCVGLGALLEGEERRHSIPLLGEYLSRVVHCLLFIYVQFSDAREGVIEQGT